MNLEQNQMKDYLGELEILNAKNIIGVYSCIDTLYYHIQIDENDYIEFYHKFLIDKSCIHIDSLKLCKNQDLDSLKYMTYFEFLDESGLCPICRIGFKQPNNKDKRHNIYVELDASAIHLFGVDKLLICVDNLMNSFGLVTIEKYVTRIDYCLIVNGVQFEYLRPSLFRTRARFGSYIDNSDDDFLRVKENEVYTYSGIISGFILGDRSLNALRIYNKKKELYDKDRVLKASILAVRFGVDFISDIDNLWTIEFECHREYLKLYGISTVDEALFNANSMFNELMNNKFVLLTEDKRLKNNERIKVNPLWYALRDSYNYKNTVVTDLKRLTKTVSDNQILNICKYLNNQVKYLKTLGVNETAVNEINDLLLKLRA